jgi:hypothetical protein
MEMPGWAWILIVVAAVLVVAAVAWWLSARRRSEQLRERFGPEYDRTVEDASSRRRAEKELEERRDRRERLNIRPLTNSARERYGDQWRNAQAQFVDAPQAAVASADHLVIAVMRDRGYPMDDFDQRAADISVDHPQVVESYRTAHELSERSANGEASTEDLRQAMRHYRTLFDELLEASADEPLTRDRDDARVDADRDETETETREETRR